MAKHFLLGNGDELREARPPNSSRPIVYRDRLDDWRPPLVAKIQTVAAGIDRLPQTFTPGDSAVGLLTLRPEYIARSHYPSSLLRYLELESIGSRVDRLPRDDQADPTRGEFAVTLFVSGTRAAWYSAPRRLGELTDEMKAGQQLLHVESFALESPMDRIRPLDPSALPDRTEAVLQVTQRIRQLAEAQFIALVEAVGGRVMSRVTTGAYRFLALEGDPTRFHSLAAFAFLRALRSLRAVRFDDDVRTDYSGRPRSVHEVNWPSAPVQHRDARALIIDGGCAPPEPMRPYVAVHDAEGVGPALDPLGVRHGTWVASAFLFGPLDGRAAVAPPPVGADVIRITEHAVLDSVTAATRLQAILKRWKHPLVCLSIGAPSPVVDEIVDPWTATVDEASSRGDRLVAIAVGNAGRSAAPRIQPPSDAVNAMAVGAIATRAAPFARADYSCLGPGRYPGRRKPDVAAFGGSADEPFLLVDAAPAVALRPGQGTSYASPFALRLGAALGLSLGAIPNRWLLARALMLHGAVSDAGPRDHVGWGRLPEDLDHYLTTGDDGARVVYAGHLPLKLVTRLKVPTPSDARTGVHVRVTLCIASPIEPSNAAHYTQAGAEVSFKMVTQRVGRGPEFEHQAFFSKHQHEMVPERIARRHLMKWETVVHAEKRFRKALSLPEVWIHPLRRKRGADTSSHDPIPYACVVTTTRVGDTEWQVGVRRRFRQTLRPLRAAARIRV